MSPITLEKAQAGLADLIHGLGPGEEVTITENDRPVARLVSVPAQRIRPPVTGVPRVGSVPGLVVPDDFKAPLDEMREYLE